MSYLVDDLYHFIINNYVDYKDCITWSRVNKYFNHYCQQEILWEKFFKQKYILYHILFIIISRLNICISGVCINLNAVEIWEIIVVNLQIIIKIDAIFVYLKDKTLTMALLIYHNLLIFYYHYKLIKFI